MVSDDDYRTRWNADDFMAHLPSGRFLFVPTGDLWPRVSVDGQLPPVQLDDGTTVPASQWLVKNRSLSIGKTRRGKIVFDDLRELLDHVYRRHDINMSELAIDPKVWRRN